MKFHFYRIKKLDIFVLKSFFQLFVGTFFICLFIYLMQFLWRYVDELVGKGFTIDVLARFFYLSGLMFMAQALPLAILLAALITFGNFGERSELIAMKAAGIPLLRIMAPLITAMTLLAGVSFYFQNVTAPDAQLRLYTLIYSMKQTSPELEIPEGAFYEEIDGYNFYVKHKNRDTGMLYDVMIYNFSEGFENARILVSDSARIVSTADNAHLMLYLYNGEEFENLRSQDFNQRAVPYRRETFKEKRIIIEFDSGFSMKDGSFLNRQAASKNMKELRHSADSLILLMDSVGRAYYNEAMVRTYPPVRLDPQDSVIMARNPKALINIDSLFKSSTRQMQQNWIKIELNRVDAQSTEMEAKAHIVYSNDKDIHRHEIEWWKKITLSLACLVFFFIGAPLGAIIRKGGLGFPVVISVFTFIVYYIFETSGFKMAREGEWTVWFGCWISSFVLVPVGVFFTYKANNDSMVFNLDAYKEFFRKILGLRQSRHITKKEVVLNDTDYTLVYRQLNDLCAECLSYAGAHRFNKAPNYYRIFTTGQEDKNMTVLREHLETVMEELGNSQNNKVLQLAGNFPIVAVNAHKSPFSNRWLNMLVGVVVPVGLFFYFRVWGFGLRLDKDLKSIVQASHDLQALIDKEHLRVEAATSPAGEEAPEEPSPENPIE